MEVWLVWAAIFAGGAFGVLIALLIAAERELRRFKGIERSAGQGSAIIAGPRKNEAIRSQDQGRVADLVREKSQLLAQIAELKEENKAKQDRIIQLKAGQGQRHQSPNDRLPAMEKRVGELEE